MMRETPSYTAARRCSKGMPAGVVTAPKSTGVNRLPMYSTTPQPTMA